MSNDANFILFPKIAECSYVSCYCEENVWKLCEQVKKTRPTELSKCYAVFVSNEGRTVPLWRQKAGRGDDKVVIWDYHVFFMHNPTPTRCLIFDLDTTLPFPTYYHKYVTETFRSDLALRPEHHRFFRVIPAEQYLAEFSSDRRHMRRPDGTWIKPPPPYPPIQSSDVFQYGVRVHAATRECSMSGGLCVQESDCHQMTYKRGLCGETGKNVECCYQVIPRAGPCKQFGGECMANCAPQLRNSLANDCGDSKVCCVLV